MAGGFCAQPSPFPTWITKVKQSFNSERKNPYRLALERCSATMRDGLCLAQQPAADTMGKNAKQHQGFVVVVPWFTLSKSLWICSLYWLEKEWEGGAACCPCQLMSAFPAKKCWAGWEICSVITGALDRQNRITLILGFCLFPVL